MWFHKYNNYRIIKESYIKENENQERVMFGLEGTVHALKITVAPKPDFISILVSCAKHQSSLVLNL